MGLKVQLTQYGYKNDPDGDTLTEEGFGAWGNQLNGGSCAIKRSTAEALPLKPLQKVEIEIGLGTTIYRWWDDVIPESDPGDRCDLYQPKGYDDSLPDFATISPVEDTGSTRASAVDGV